MVTTIKKLRISTKEVLSSVVRGNEVVVTNHGKPYVKIVPITPINKNGIKSESNVSGFLGMWKDHEDLKDVQEYLRNLRKPRYAR